MVRNLDFTIVPMVNDATEVAFRWSGSGTSGHRLEVGSSSGASDVALLDVGPSTSYLWTRVPVGNFYARVKGLQGASVGAPSNEVLVGSIDARQMIDALLFAYGPLAVARSPGRSLLSGPRLDRMLGWQPGTGLAVVFGESVPAATVSAAEKTVQQIGPATRGAVQAGVVGRRPDPLPLPAPGEVTLSMAEPAEVLRRCNCETCVGCAATFYSGSFAQRAWIVMSTTTSPPTAAHELGHVIGLAHVISAAGVRPSFTMGVTTDGQYSPAGRLDELDPATVRMLETIYGAGFTAGSSRRQFEAAGLVPPEGTGAAPLAASDRRSGYVVTEEGAETLVLKPLCEGPS